MGALATIFIPQAGFDLLGENWQLCLNLVIALPPKPPWLDSNQLYFVQIQSGNQLRGMTAGQPGGYEMHQAISQFELQQP